MQISRKHKIAKAKFWQRIAKNQALVPDDMDDATIARVSGCLDVQISLKNSEFREWFLDESANEALLEAGVEAAIRRLIDIVEMSGSDLIGKDAEAKTSDQVRAAEMLLRYAGYGPVKEQPGAIGKDLDKMSAAELDSYIASKSKKLKAAGPG